MARYEQRLDQVAPAHELPFWQSVVNLFTGIEAVRGVTRARTTFNLGSEWFRNGGRRVAAAVPEPVTRTAGCSKARVPRVREAAVELHRWTSIRDRFTRTRSRVRHR